MPDAPDAAAVTPSSSPMKRPAAPRKITSSESMQNLNDLARLEEGSASARGRILVLLTGGTMAMRPNARGALEPAPGYLADQMRLMPELRDVRMACYDVVEYDPLLDSADMVPGDWARIAGDVAAAHDAYAGFVVIMGTDTMAYVASALSFLLEGLRRPVVLTGSMVPFAAAHTDARRNLVTAMGFAGSLDWAEVCVCFGDKLLRGNRATKVDALALAAYDSPNFPPLATVGVALNARDDLALRAPPPPPEAAAAACAVACAMETKILVIRMVPGFDDGALLACVRSGVRAVVLELYGCGTAPARKHGVLAFLRAARRAGVLVAATTQCRRGGVALATYEVGRKLADAGVIGCGDMTTECAAVKLAYLFGRYGGDAAAVRKLVAVPLRGELSPPETYLRPLFEDGPRAAPRPRPAAAPHTHTTTPPTPAIIRVPADDGRPRRARRAIAVAVAAAAVAVAAVAAARRRRGAP